MALFYLSFATDADGFKGAVIVHADSFLCAVQEATIRGINPHGEVFGGEIPADAVQPEGGYINRLLTKAEVCSIWPESKSMKEWDAEDVELSK